VLIYVLIHANPPQLASNLMYIERFRMHSRMMSESAYFFTQLVRCCFCDAHAEQDVAWHDMEELLEVVMSGVWAS
jgi:Vacuolar sorting protein 9 (VPS9) domain